MHTQYNYFDFSIVADYSASAETRRSVFLKATERETVEVTSFPDVTISLFDSERNKKKFTLL